MRSLETAVGNIDLQETAQKLKRNYEYKQKFEANWAHTNNGFICCHSGKTLFLTNGDFEPLLIYESSSFIEASGISEAGNYMICQTAYNNENDEDSKVTILFDVREQKVVQRRKIGIGGLDTRLISIDEQNKLICIHVADKVLGEGNNIIVKYNFELQAEEESLSGYYNKPDISPYTLNGTVKALIAEIQNGVKEWNEEIEKEILDLLEKLKADIDMSHYQLSLTYKELGDLYDVHNEKEKAILAYETGLLLNKNLSVKKKLNSLKKGFSGRELSKPYVKSLERKKAFEQEDYVLPPTYDKDWRKKRELYNEKLGITPSRSTYQNTETYHAASESEQAKFDNIAEILRNIGDNFVEGLKTDSLRFVENIKGLNDISDHEFNLLFNKLCEHQDNFFKKEARKMAESKISKMVNGVSSMTVREEIIMELHSMLKYCK